MSLTACENGLNGTQQGHTLSQIETDHRTDPKRSGTEHYQIRATLVAHECVAIASVTYQIICIVYILCCMECGDMKNERSDKYLQSTQAIQCAIPA